ncbi:MAG: CPBP family intramembrane metalloprotease [Bacilli bacterium]|nr:CPBP family intramembrane metalloprotease [Bacilli bacterium]
MGFYINACYNVSGDMMIIDQSKNRYKYIFKGLGIIFLYFAVSFFKYLPFDLLHINRADIKDFSLIVYNLAIEMVLIVAIYSIYEKEFRLAISDIKKNHKMYFDKYLKVYLIGVILMIGSNMIINILGGGISENEGTIRKEMQMFPIYTYISAVFLAPILEEMIFRLGIRSIVKNNVIYIILSGLIFGGLHLIGTPINILFPLYLLSYCSSGWGFAYMMSKSNNVLVSSGFHLMHNGIILSIQFFLLIFT